MWGEQGNDFLAPTGLNHVVKTGKLVFLRWHCITRLETEKEESLCFIIWIKNVLQNAHVLKDGTSMWWLFELNVLRGSRAVWSYLGKQVTGAVLYHSRILFPGFCSPDSGKWAALLHHVLRPRCFPPNQPTVTLSKPFLQAACDRNLFHSHR